MTKLETYWYPEAIPGFDVLKWKQENQARIYQEIKDMTSDEYLEYIRKGAERFDKEQTRRQAEMLKSQ